jgi:hypothetical protein
VSTAIAKQMHAIRSAIDLLLLNMPLRAIGASKTGPGPLAHQARSRNRRRLTLVRPGYRLCLVCGRRANGSSVF